MLSADFFELDASRLLAGARTPFWKVPLRSLKRQRALSALPATTAMYDFEQMDASQKTVCWIWVGKKTDAGIGSRALLRGSNVAVCGIDQKRFRETETGFDVLCQPPVLLREVREFCFGCTGPADSFFQFFCLGPVFARAFVPVRHRVPQCTNWTTR